MSRLVPLCCARMLRTAGWHGVPAEVRMCPRCRRTWAWQDGAWWQGPKVPLTREDE